MHIPPIPNPMPPLPGFASGPRRSPTGVRAPLPPPKASRMAAGPTAVAFGNAHSDVSWLFLYVIGKMFLIT